MTSASVSFHCIMVHLSQLVSLKHRFHHLCHIILTKVCSTIYRSKYRFCLICVFVRCVTEQPSFSQQNSSLFLLSPPHPLFIPSSHLISSPLILRFSQEALDRHQWGSKRGARMTEKEREREKRMEKEEDDEKRAKKVGGKTESDQIKEKQKRHERRRQRQIDGHRDEE